MKNSFKTILAICTGFILLLSACSTQEQSVWVPAWKETSSLAEARAGIATVQANGYIYAIGGLDGEKFLKSTEYAKINEDGSLGPWKSGPPLHEERAWMEAVAHNGYVYVVGGANAGGKVSAYAGDLLASVERAKINPDGSLEPWIKEKHSMRVPRRCNKVVVWNNRIYSVGGYAIVMLDSVEFTEIQEDGSLGEWTMNPKNMLVPHYVNGVKAKNGALYVFGGHAHKDGVGLKIVEWSKIDEKTGELPEWKHTSKLQTGRHGHATAYHDGRFYVLSGFTGTKLLDSVEKATLKPDGELNPWEFTTPMSTIRMNYNVVVYKDWIYAISGTNDTGYLTSVDYATINDQGDIGFYGTGEDKVAHEKKVADREEARLLAAKEEFRFKGVVKEILRTDGYTYMKVPLTDGTVWFAVPNPDVEINVDDTILFGKALYMPNFYSKQLDRNFKMLFFLDRVKKVE